MLIDLPNNVCIVYSNIIITNAFKCCVNHKQILMQWIPITATHILTILFTVLLYLIIYIDGTVIQHATNNVDACTHCAHLFLEVLLHVLGASWLWDDVHATGDSNLIALTFIFFLFSKIPPI